MKGYREIIRRLATDQDLPDNPVELMEAMEVELVAFIYEKPPLAVASSILTQRMRTEMESAENDE